MVAMDYKTRGVCARMIHVELDNTASTIENVAFEGGCNGNLKAIAKLVQGMPVTQVVALLRGNTCGKRSTSCADQLTLALREAQAAARVASRSEVHAATQAPILGDTRSVAQPADQDGAQDASQPADQDGAQAASQPADQGGAQAASQPAGQGGTQAATQPAGQGGTQTATQPAVQDVPCTPSQREPQATSQGDSRADTNTPAAFTHQEETAAVRQAVVSGGVA